jgi:hypothetical protein
MISKASDTDFMKIITAAERKRFSDRIRASLTQCAVEVFNDFICMKTPAAGNSAEQ